MRWFAARHDAEEKTAAVGGLWSDRFGTIATRSLQTLIVLGLVAIAIYLATRVPLILTPVIIALIFASAFAPLVLLLRRWGLPATVATVLTLLLVLLVLGGIVYFITVSVRSEGPELVSSASDGIDQLVGWLQSLGIVIDQDQFEQFRQQAIDFVTSAQFGTGALAGVGVVGDFVTGLAVMVVTLFFFLKDGGKIWGFLLRPFEGRTFERYDRAGKKVVSVLGSYVRGTAIVAAADSILIGIALFAVGVPLVIPLIAIIFLTAFIPIIGATIAGALAAVLALVANGPVAALIVLAVVVAVNQIDGNILQPLVQGRSLQLHPLVILLALTAGTVLAGLTGALLAVPIAASVWGVITVWEGPNRPARFVQQKRPEPN
ncbi:MAG TPA: AI-2E family transporter [Rhodoglobus sp.]|nr:AI-2E family transporter [Rhodoglobus sp.]